MNHIFKKGNPDKPTLVLLHGTGGNEHDLLPIAEMIDQEASVLGIRGNVLENGMPRFFKRLAEGVFDEEDLKFRTKELNDYLTQAADDYEFDRENVIAIGYSNGANIAASLMYHYNDAFKGAILFHAMVPLKNIELPSLKGTEVFVGAGKNDPIIPAENTQQLISDLEKAGAHLEAFWTNAGHQLTREEVEAAKEWYQKLV
ncbi:carboxylesterase [Alkalihalobacillus alcalophilus ATCC 27647 = CGMCC 1.3604]|uniref:Carboxylesterase n=1 Tax=Alkalihalobacillus alcalophilus ATCC 27647 = CGMCC 1.3604 TaxID=1218173 RepID=A0A094YV75_ALKAL|nr:alpha/beta hydrolase [Alkalihalobacillus alcalophilus]KGA97417.1 carboxylesterase [Alkalihalobacillus alcalophilus ATCC 27647 = CGMCC 1.3604]MED1561572.1 alpha/beta hydrolase [Alkalihalobacillus alcalophilus]THG90970.1 carboxylesterase [Alkalihalobacillus alcalophilus ATCC 27647 = CGMCC 1.3604]